MGNHFTSPKLEQIYNIQDHCHGGYTFAEYSISKNCFYFMTNTKIFLKFDVNTRKETLLMMIEESNDYSKYKLSCDEKYLLILNAKSLVVVNVEQATKKIYESDLYQKWIMDFDYIEQMNLLVLAKKDVHLIKNFEVEKAFVISNPFKFNDIQKIHVSTKNSPFLYMWSGKELKIVNLQSKKIVSKITADEIIYFAFPNDNERFIIISTTNYVNFYSFHGHRKVTSVKYPYHKVDTIDLKLLKPVVLIDMMKFHALNPLKEKPIFNPTINPKLVQFKSELGITQIYRYRK